MKWEVIGSRDCRLEIDGDIRLVKKEYFDNQLLREAMTEKLSSAQGKKMMVDRSGADGLRSSPLRCPAKVPAPAVARVVRPHPGSSARGPWCHRWRGGQGRPGRTAPDLKNEDNCPRSFTWRGSSGRWWSAADVAAARLRYRPELQPRPFRRTRIAACWFVVPREVRHYAALQGA